MARVFPPEFRAQILEMHRKGKSAGELAREFNISATTVANWVKQDRVDSGQEPGLTTDDKAEIADLRRQLKQREEELEVLGKALAFFVRRGDL